jgi:ATP phosphoribosyltransferase regulatory subunit HisZ
MKMTPANSAEVVWQNHDKKHRGWTVHLQVGAEVIKYPAPHPGPDHSAADAELISLAVNAARDDGYELNPTAVKITR